MHIRYYANPQAIAALKRDGIGWDHNLRSGSLEGLDSPPLGPLARLNHRLKGHFNGTT